MSDRLDEAMARARARIPGMSQLVSKAPDQFSMGAWPAYFKRAKGATVWDLDDRPFTDMSIAGIGANILGYARDEVDEAVIASIRAGSSSSLNAIEEVDLADAMCAIHPWADMARFTRSGGEAMAVAVRIARASSGRSTVLFCGYHGWHDWYLAANLGDATRLDGHLLPGLSPRGVPRHLAGSSIPYQFNDVASLQEACAQAGDDLAAIVLEPTRGTPPTAEFIRAIQATCQRTGAVFVVDEISSGFRMNHGGVHLELGFAPDMAVFSKALGNGYPIAAVIGRAAVMEAAATSFISSTNWSERIGPVAALATLAVHRDKDVAARLMHTGKAVMRGWSEAASAHGLAIEVGGLPPLAHFRFEDGDAGVRKATVVEGMLEKGFLASTIFYAMDAHTEAHVEAYLAALDDVFATIAAHDDVTLEGRLRGLPALPPFARLVT